MKFTQDMMLQSDSGYCMPFEEKGKDVRQGKCSSITESISQSSIICCQP